MKSKMETCEELLALGEHIFIALQKQEITLNLEKILSQDSDVCIRIIIIKKKCKSISVYKLQFSNSFIFNYSKMCEGF